MATRIDSDRGYDANSNNGKQQNESRSSAQRNKRMSWKSSDGDEADHNVTRKERATLSIPSTSQRDASHRIDAAGSVQALAIDDDVIFAGLQGGYIVAWSLDTYECLAKVRAHQESVLGLSLSDDQNLLFSTGADSVINVWSTQSLQRLYSLPSYYEVGDVFCAAYSTKRRTVFCGCQNASIQWHTLDSGQKVQSHSFDSSTTSRKSRFFASVREGDVVSATKAEDSNTESKGQGGRIELMSESNYAPFAHNSYVYSILLARGLFQHDREEEVLISSGGGGTIKLWGVDDLCGQGLVQLFKIKNPGFSILSLAHRGFFLYAGLSNGLAHIYNLESQQLVQKLQVGHGDVTQIQIFKDFVYCGTSEGWIKRYNNQFTEMDEWHSNNGKILATVLTSRLGQDVLATGGNDKTINIWIVSDVDSTSTSAVLHSNDELINALREFVGYRTVAGVPRCVNDCHQAVNFLRKKCNAFGATTTLFSPDDNVNPILVAKFRASTMSKTKKSILFYGHYDVVDAQAQTIGSNDTWYADPFSLYPLNGCLYGRGVTDNKGPILAAIYAVADLTQQSALSCNVTFLLEGDEEAGSRGFRKAVEEHHNEIGSVDYILLSNSYWLEDNIPCLTFGMRGVVHATIMVSSNKPDLHSGMDGTSTQHEPLKDLTILIGALIGENGMKVMIPGFNEKVDELDQAELEAYKTITSTLLRGHREIKDEEKLATSLRQRWRYPNLTVHRIEVPESKKTVTIAGAAKATLSIRIVPKQTAEEVAKGLTTFLEGQFAAFQSPNKLSVEITAKADPWLGDIHSTIYEKLSTAITEVWTPKASASSRRSFQTPEDEIEAMPASVAHRTRNRRASTLVSHGTFIRDDIPREPLFIREGGSIPAISFLENEFDAPAAMFPMGQASDSAHLDNERMSVQNLYKGRDVLKKVFSRL